MVGQRRAGRLGVVHRVQQERTAGLQPLQHVVLVDVRRHVACHEVGGGHQVGRRDRQVAETQVRRGVAARFLRVIGEIGLAVLVGRASDDLDRVLVGAHRTVGAQTEEEALERAGLRERNLLADGQRTERHVVDDTHRELVLRLVHLQVLEHGQHLRRSGVLRRKAVTPADDERLAVARAGGERLHDIHIQRVAVGSRLLRAVEHADALHALGKHGHQVFHRERAVEVHGHYTHLFALGHQVVDRLLDGLGHRTHGDDHVLGVLRAVVDERLVVASRDLRNLLHGVGHHVGNGVVELVRSLARLEIDVGILGRTARNRVFGVQSAGAELLQGVAVEQRRQRGFVDQFDLLDLVRGAETVEEVQERNAGLQRHEVRDAGEVHDLLHRRGGQHGKTRLAGRHHILMIAENRQRLCGQRTRRNVEHARKQLAGDLVHVGDHQQQTLRSGERRGQGAALQRSVHGACGSGLGLHFNDFNGLSEDIFTALGGPLVHELGHRRRRRDGIDGRDFREHVSHMGRSVVTITSDKFLFCHFS